MLSLHNGYVPNQSHPPKAILTAMERAQQGLEELSAVAVASPAEARAFVHGISEVVHEAEKLSRRLGEILQTTKLLNAGLSPQELYGAMVERSQTLRDELRVSEVLWSEPASGAALMRRGLRSLELLSNLATELQEESIPQLVRRAMIWQVERAICLDRPSREATGIQGEKLREIQDQINLMLTAFELVEQSRFAVPDEAARRIYFPTLTGPEGLDPGKFLHELERAPLQAFQTILLSDKAETIQLHGKTLRDLAKCQESHGVPMAVEALQYLLLQSKHPDVIMGLLSDVKHPTVADFAERILLYPKSFLTHASGSRPPGDQEVALRRNALKALIADPDEGRLFKVRQQLVSDAQIEKRGHALAVFTLAFSSLAQNHDLPLFSAAHREIALEAIDPAFRANYLQQLSQMAASSFPSTQQQIKESIAPLARAALKLIAAPEVAPIPFARHGYTLALFGQLHVLPGASTSLCRAALSCLGRFGTSDDLERIDHLVRERQLRSCINIDSPRYSKEPTLYECAKAAKAQIKQRLRAAGEG
jgi:DNA polymerase III psi subunit